MESESSMFLKGLLENDTILIYFFAGTDYSFDLIDEEVDFDACKQRIVSDLEVLEIVFDSKFTWNLLDLIWSF